MTRPEPPDTVQIFDTTLRDGEQSPGAALTSAEKLAIAHQLARLGIDIIEAGFPAASPDDLEGVRRIAAAVGRSGGPVIAGLARASRGDIDAAWRAVSPAHRPRIHTFLATSDLHMERKLGMSRDEVVERTGAMVAYARRYCDDVEFSPEDASRSDWGFLCQVLGTAIEAGATVLNIPDTVGYTTPDEFFGLLRHLRQHTPGAETVCWSVHCHNDLGLATANTLAGIRAGARQVEVTINGIGERAGNTSLEEVVMALTTRPRIFGVHTAINTPELVRTSQMVSHYTGIVVQPNKAIVGDNAFAHEAGIHQDGMLKDQRTYEIMTPESVGWRVSRLVLGKHSGRHALKVHLADLGFPLDDAALAEVFPRFKALADRQKEITDHDLRHLVAGDAEPAKERYTLVELHVSCGRPGMSTATVKIHDREAPEAEHIAAGIGIGPVEAAFRAIETAIHRPVELVEFNVHNLDPGLDADGEVTVRITDPCQRTVGGTGASRDIVQASALAYTRAISRLAALDDPAQLPAREVHHHG
jgi:2-isopropylmalate synthase